MYNDELMHKTEKQGAVESHDNLPLATEGTEGNDLGKWARPPRADLGDLDPARPQNGAAVTEYRPPESNLPEFASALDGYKRLPGSGGGL